MEKEKYDIPRILSNNKELTEKDILTLLVLMKQGRITSHKLLEELNLRGANLSDPNSAAHYRKKLEKMGIVEGYTAKINWEKLGYPTEFIVIATSNTKDRLLGIEKVHIAAIEEYREQIDTNIFVIPITEKGDKIILKNVLFCGEKPIAIISGVANDNKVAVMYSNFYLPKRYPGIDTTLLIIQSSSIRDFEFKDKSIESLIPVLFSEGEINKYREEFKKEFRWDLIKQGK